MKIVGNTVGTTMPKPNLMQTDPSKGDYVKGKEEFVEQVGSNDVDTVKTVNGVAPDENGNVEIGTGGGSGQNATATAMDYDQNVHSVNHRGYSATAPENTIPAYILSKQKGFTYVEADVSFTSDGVAVLLHDKTIDRTSDGSGSISAMTYAEASKYDYGSWKSSDYTGTRIPTFEEFIILCKRIGLHPYIELKQNGAYTQAQIQALVAMVKNCGMDGKVTWISFAPSYLEYVKAADASARLGYLVSSVTDAVITTAHGLRTDGNEVFIDSSDYDADAISRCQTAGLPLEIWTINSTSIIQNMNAYITGVTSDNLIAGKVLYDAGMVYEYGIDGDEPDEPDTPTVTLSSISAVYSGGDVAVGTAVTELTGIVVTAHYSDGTSEAVTGYTLSGTIAEGENTVTVTYEGKTATFSVIGVNESGGGDNPDEPGDNDPALIYNWDFTKSVIDTVSGRTAELNYVNLSIGVPAGTTAPRQTDAGLIFDGALQYCDLGEVTLAGHTVEIDVAEFDFKGITTAHIRFVMHDTGGNGSLIWRKATGWAQYSGAWSDVYGDAVSGATSDIINYFSGKTVKIVFGDTGCPSLYVNGEHIGTASAAQTGARIYIGASPNTGHAQNGGNQCYNMTITGIRIYTNA